MIIAVIDGMGGGIGSEIVENLRKKISEKDKIIALGTNAIATSVMVKSGAFKGATGENAIRVSVQKSDIILGPLGIIIPNSMMGEITPLISESIANSEARKILLPIKQNHLEIAGLKEKSLKELIEESIKLVFEEKE